MGQRRHPELKRAIRKLNLMAILRSDRHKIHVEMEKYFCRNCKNKSNPPACQLSTRTRMLGTLSDSEKKIQCFAFEGYVIFKCWKPK